MVGGLSNLEKSADSGKHILCEKPLTLNASEAREAIEYTKKKRVLVGSLPGSNLDASMKSKYCMSSQRQLLLGNLRLVTVEMLDHARLAHRVVDHAQVRYIQCAILLGPCLRLNVASNMKIGGFNGKIPRL